MPHLPVFHLRWLPRFSFDRPNDTFTLDLSGCRVKVEGTGGGTGSYEFCCWLGLIFFGVQWASPRISRTPVLCLGFALVLWALRPALRSEPPVPSARPPVLTRMGERLAGRVEVAPAPSVQPPGFTEAVLASYYHPGLAGRPMKNLELYGRDRMIAASLDLPIGSWALIGRQDLSCVVEITDRGPFPNRDDPRHGSRAIDLGERPARLLGLIERGVATVTIHPLALGPGKPF